MGRWTPTTAFDELPILYLHNVNILKIYLKEVCLEKYNFWQKDSSENIDNFSLIWLLYMNWQCLHRPINSYHSLTNITKTYWTDAWRSSLLKIMLMIFSVHLILPNVEFHILKIICTDSAENIYVSWSTTRLRVRLAPLNRFKPSSKIFYWPFQGGTSFVDLLCFCSVLCLLCFVRVCLYVLFGHLLGKGWPLGSRLWCLLWVCHFPIGILGQVWYLIVSIPDLCTITYF